MMEHFQSIKQDLEQKKVTLVAVSKTYGSNHILPIYEMGQMDFGENKVQELISKYEILPKDIRWHLIGHLQSNKVKYVAPFVHMIHSVDSVKLAKEVNNQAMKYGRQINCLLQLKVAQEDRKFGISISRLEEVLEEILSLHLNHIQWKGIMGMASFTDDLDQVRSEFQLLRTCFEKIQSQFFPNEDDFDTISMGMSGDYNLAIEEGSNMVRIGSLIFGKRDYN